MVIDKASQDLETKNWRLFYGISLGLVWVNDEIESKGVRIKNTMMYGVHSSKGHNLYSKAFP